jgi:peptidoglycan hydrolase-like protein with peptidoglycan-binding domain
MRVGSVVALMAIIAAMTAPAAGAATADSADGFGTAAVVPVSAPSAPVVAIAATRDGYWLGSVTGGVVAAGAATSGRPAGMDDVVGIAAADDHGYWLVNVAGNVTHIGDALALGSAGRLVRPIVGMAATPDGKGYWLVASDGGVFSFGDARFDGSTGAMTLNEPIVGMAATPDGGGYWLAARDGGVFNFGDAPFVGSDGATRGPETVGIARFGSGFLLAHGELPTDGDRSPGHLEALLATLGYLPLTWTPAGQQPGSATDVVVAEHASASAGTFAWRFPPPPSLGGLWVEGQDSLMLQGAVMAFESVVGLPLDGEAGPAVWSALLDGQPPMNPNGYTYALASKASPETLTVWHDGAVVSQSRANTGISAAPTVDGTFPVYERLRSQIMTGTNPDGSKYADPVQWVAYFNGGDAVHYIARSSFGYPQSLGCVEVPYNVGETIWPYLTYGTLVTVS